MSQQLVEGTVNTTMKRARENKKKCEKKKEDMPKRQRLEEASDSFDTFLDFQKFCEETLHLQTVYPVDTNKNYHVYQVQDCSHLKGNAKKQVSNFLNDILKPICWDYCIPWKLSSDFLTAILNCDFIPNIHSMVPDIYKTGRFVAIKDPTVSYQFLSEQKYGKSTGKDCLSTDCTNKGNTKYDGYCRPCGEKKSK